jgi:hypothetical protein
MSTTLTAKPYTTTQHSVQDERRARGLERERLDFDALQQRNVNTAATVRSSWRRRSRRRSSPSMCPRSRAPTSARCGGRCGASAWSPWGRAGSLIRTSQFALPSLEQSPLSRGPTSAPAASAKTIRSCWSIARRLLKTSVGGRLDLSVVHQIGTLAKCLFLNLMAGCGVAQTGP